MMKIIPYMLLTIVLRALTAACDGTTNRFSGDDDDVHGDDLDQDAGTPADERSPYGRRRPPNGDGSSTTGAASRLCRTNADCGDPQLGQTCHWLYDGCLTGRCMCDPRRHLQDPEGHCRSLKTEAERCSDAVDMCQAGMQCVDGRCRCPDGSHLTDDGLHCLRPGEKLLGQRCSPSFDTCLHKSANVYTRFDVHCSPVTGHCTCAEGYKHDSISCRKWNIEERGCRRSIHCEGGALCVDGRCACPVTHVAIAGNSKCAMRGAVTDLPSGAICDEINETRYCARPLVCLRCPADDVYKCVRFLMSSDYAFLWSSASDAKRDQFVIVLFLSAIVTVVINQLVFFNR